MIPDQWKKSRWHTSDRVLQFWTVAGTLASIFGAYMSLRTMTFRNMVINLLVCAAALLFGYFVEKSGHVHMEVSYEEQ